MAFDELKNMAMGWINTWNKGKLQKKLKETAQHAVDLTIENSELEKKISDLIDENRRIKGEQSKPKIKPVNTNDLNPKPKKKHKKSSKKIDLDIDEEVELDVDKADLPKDAKFIGSRDIVIQDIKFERRNIRFTSKRYYSKELGRVIEGEVPAEFKGSEFGPKLRAHILYLYYKCRVPHKKIQELLADLDIHISSGSICSILNNLSENFELDLDSARTAALRRDSRVHIDDTGAKINGRRAYTFGVSHQFFTHFTTSFEKNRWASVGALFGGEQRFVIDEAAISFIAKKLKRPKVTVFFNLIKNDRVYSRFELEEFFNDPVFDDVTKVQRDIVRTGCALSFANSTENGPPIRFLISDEGTNFISLIKNHQLCWVHEIRKYKLCELFKRIESETLEKLLIQWRAFYKLMKRYRNNPCAIQRIKIRSEFDRITKIKTFIKALDAQLARTRKNKDKLLLFLKYPQLPLDNNLCERDLRERVIKRKISLQNRSLQGVKAWDLMLSLASTCRKIDLSFWRYLEDRISRRESIPYLGKLIKSY